MIRAICGAGVVSLGAGCVSHHGVPVSHPLPEDHPRVYVAARAMQPIEIDGRINEGPWLDAPWTATFVDIEHPDRPRPRHDTRAKMLWDDEYFYVAAWMDEPHLWGTLTARDSIIYRDNDFEIFIDPDGDRIDYDEYEINALGTEFDLRLNRPYRDGGTYDIGWDIEGIKSAVHLEGTLNDPSDTDRGWSVEVAIPWAALADTAHVPCPPRHGDIWWVNFSRVQWPLDITDGGYVKPDGAREDNWVWSPQGAIDMHRPEYWGSVQFKSAPPGPHAYAPGPDARWRTQLKRLKAAVEVWRGRHGGAWPVDIEDLDGLWTPVEDCARPEIVRDGDDWRLVQPGPDRSGEMTAWSLTMTGAIVQDHSARRGVLATPVRQTDQAP